MKPLGIWLALCGGLLLASTILGFISEAIQRSSAPIIILLLLGGNIWIIYRVVKGKWL